MMISKQTAYSFPSPHFYQESSALLQQIETELRTLRQDFSVQKVHTLMRLAHTLKGAAATVGLDAIKTTTQILEYTFKALCFPEARLTNVVEGLIFENYKCLRLLLHTLGDPSSEVEILKRVTGIGSQLQQNLGDRFGQTVSLPTSTQLGIDVTQSIFESGVTEYLDELAHAVAIGEPQPLRELLKVQAEVFIGLAESLRLPGIGNIARATLTALQQHPDRVTTIAQLALADYRTAQTAVLQGDRIQGGAPSNALKQLGNPPVSNQKSKQTNWLNTLWQWLNQPISSAIWTAQISQQSQVSSPSTIKTKSLNTVFYHCQQLLDELTQQHQKPVLVNIKGGEARLAATTIEQLSTPLTVLVKNAFVQNIEAAEVRRKWGKAALGTIQLAAKQTDSAVVICVWDDGCGAAPRAVWHQVQPQITALQGKITMAHRPHKGTCFTLKIPAT